MAIALARAAALASPAFEIVAVGFIDLTMSVMPRPPCFGGTTL